MAKRRRVQNLTALGVLSALAFRDMHPYEIAGALRSWNKESDLQIKWGSFYTVVRNLAKHGLIAPVESVRAGNRPERTVYAITDEGRAELVDWTRELLTEAGRESFLAGLSVATMLGPDEVASLLQQRLTTIAEAERSTRDELARARDVPRVFLLETEYELSLLAAEAGWMRGLLAALADGEEPWVPAWRHFHATGELPPELRAMAENRDRS